jgi:hypothetical protein
MELETLHELHLLCSHDPWRIGKQDEWRGKTGLLLSLDRKKCWRCTVVLSVRLFHSQEATKHRAESQLWRHPLSSILMQLWGIKSGPGDWGRSLSDTSSRPNLSLPIIIRWSGNKKQVRDEEMAEIPRCLGPHQRILRLWPESLEWWAGRNKSRRH